MTKMIIFVLGGKLGLKLMFRLCWAACLYVCRYAAVPASLIVFFTFVVELFFLFDYALKLKRCTCNCNFGSML
jgi:hypothetical protein